MKLRFPKFPFDIPSEFASVFAGLARDGIQAAIVIANSFSSVHRQEIIASAARNGIATMYEVRIFAVDGGLVSYGVEGMQLFRGAAGYVDKVLKGASVSDLPVQQATEI